MANINFSDKFFEKADIIRKCKHSCKLQMSRVPKNCNVLFMNFDIFDP